MLTIILIIFCVISSNLVVSVNNNRELEENDYSTGLLHKIANTVDINETPDPNVNYEGFVSYATEDDDSVQKKEEQVSMDELILTKTLLNGSNEEIRTLQVALVLQSLTAIDKIQISLNKRLIIWNMVKENKSVNVLKRSDLEKSGKLVLIIPEIDLYNLNYSDWDVVDYLGTLSGLTRRRTGIIGYALKQKWGANIITNMEYINRMKGILCAFSPQELFSITPKQFCEISGEVFQNIRSCTKRQLKVLINTATRTIVFGPIQSWNMTTTARLALLITSLDDQELKLIRPEAMEGISYETIKAMPKEKLVIFDEDQISFLDDLSLAAYRRLTGIDSNINNCCRRVAEVSRSIYYVIVLIIFVVSIVFDN